MPKTVKIPQIITNTFISEISFCILVNTSITSYSKVAFSFILTPHSSKIDLYKYYNFIDAKSSNIHKQCLHLLYVWHNADIFSYFPQ